MIERPSVRRVARIEEQDSVGNQYRHANAAAIRNGFDIYRVDEENGAITYEISPEAKARVKQITSDTVEFSLINHELTEPKIAAALALVAFAEIAVNKQSTTKRIISLVPRDFENPEYDGSSPDPLFVDVLGMRGEGLTLDGELIYLYEGEPREMLWMATEALKNQIKPLIYSKITDIAA